MNIRELNELEQELAFVLCTKALVDDLLTVHTIDYAGERTMVLRAHFGNTHFTLCSAKISSILPQNSP